MLKKVIILFLITFYIPSLFAGKVEVTIMAPLYIGDINSPNSEYSISEWQKFESGIARLKSIGVHAISVDVWWGLVQSKTAEDFDWSYYDKIFSIIKKNGLKIQAILSFHKAGGNVGDTVNIPLPNFSFDPENYPDVDIQTSDDLKYIGADGAVSDDCHSAYVTGLVMPFLERFMMEFRDHFSSIGESFDEINLSLGPAGELRFPSYKAGTPSDYPNSGIIQAFSRPAIRQYRRFLERRFEYSINNLIEEFGVDFRNTNTFDEIFPPKNLEYGWESRPSGYIFNRFNHGILLASAREKLAKLSKIFNAEDSPSGFRKTPIGFKVPGVHWQSANRSAEISAGVVSSNPKKFSTDPQNVGYLYEPVLDLVKVLMGKGINLRPYFTAFEMDDGHTRVEGAVNDSNNTNSLAKSLAHSVGNLAKKKGIILGGENALAGNLHNQRSFDNMLEAVASHGYSHVTLLRLEEIINHEHIFNSLKKFIISLESCTSSLVGK